MSAAWRSEPERGSPIAIALITWLTLRLGRAATRWLLVPICIYYYLFAPGPRRASRAFLAQTLERKPSVYDVLSHFHTFASILHDRLFLVSGRHSELKVSVSGESEIDRLLARGQGCVLIGSHLGSFEVLRMLGRTAGKNVNVVMHEENAKKIHGALSRLDPGLLERIIPSGQPDTILRVKACLERGEIVGMLGDRTLGPERKVGRQFLGKQAHFPLGPWVLVGALGTPAALFFGLYVGGGRYDVRFEVLTRGERVQRETRLQVATLWLSRYVGRLEHYARYAPYNWLNFYDFWDEEQG